MYAGDGPGTTERDNLPDLREREPQTSALPNEGQDTKDASRVDAVTGWCPVRPGKNATRLVQPHGLAAESTPPGNLTDE